MTQPKNIRRRRFLSGAATSALSVSCITNGVTLAKSSVVGANGLIRIGLIGAGNRAKWLTRALSRESGRVKLIAVSDCFLSQAERLKADRREAGDDPSWAVFQNYEEMFDRTDLDAVVIATPDHVRVRAAIMACQRGLDVYAEKPLSFTIPEGRALVQAVRKYKRVLQVGTQQRSTPINQYACRFVREGGLGRVDTILVKNMTGSRPVEGLDVQEIPAAMDWNRFCDQAPLLPYHPKLHESWRRYEPFTGGTICDRGAHALDMVHLAMGWEKTAPQKIQPTTAAANNWERGVRLYYPNGTVVRLESRDGPAFGGIFIGEKGKMEINRGRFASNPPDILEPFDGQTAENHVSNWIDCMESRNEPNAPVEVGHLIVSVAHLINIARRTGRTIEWDSEKEQIINNPSANELLARARRPEFSLPNLSI